MAVKRRCLFVMLLLVGFDPAAAAQDAQPKPEDKQPVEVIPFWQSDRGDQVRAALTVFGSEGQPYRALASRVAVAESVRQIGGWPFVFETVLPLRRDFLAKIKDKRPWPDLTRGDWKDLKEGADRAIYVVLNEAILRSNRAAADMFERSAAEYDHVTYRDLATEPNRYRGKVITLKGKMTVLRKIESPRMVHDEISHCYFGEVIGPTKGAPPFAVLFTELPKDVKPSEEFNRQVTVQGYFIALIRFPADKETGQKEVIAPYLVGKTITVHTKAPAVKTEQTPAQSYNIVLVAVGAVTGVLIFFMIVNLWLRRVDQRTQAKLEETRRKGVPFTLEPDEPADDPDGNEPQIGEPPAGTHP